MSVYSGIPLPELHSNTKRVRVTASGLPIGHREPLDPENPYRGKIKTVLALKAMQEQRSRGGRKAAQTKHKERG